MLLFLQVSQKLEEAYYNIVTMMLWLLIDFIGQVILEDHLMRGYLLYVQLLREPIYLLVELVMEPKVSFFRFAVAF